MKLNESILRNLKETIGYAEEETINAVTTFYSNETGASVENVKKSHTTGGGLSHLYYTKVTFSDDTIMVFLDNMTHIKLDIYKKDEPYLYEFEIWEKDFSEQIREFIAGEKPSGSYKFPTDKYNDSIFDLQDAIDNKGDIVIELEKSGDNKDEVFSMLDSLPDDMPLIEVSGLWNGMNDGTLTTVGKVKNSIDKNSIYGGKDTLVIYDNLVYLKYVSGSDMW